MSMAPVEAVVEEAAQKRLVLRLKEVPAAAAAPGPKVLVLTAQSILMTVCGKLAVAAVSSRLEAAEASCLASQEVPEVYLLEWLVQHLRGAWVPMILVVWELGEPSLRSLPDLIDKTSPYLRPYRCLPSSSASACLPQRALPAAAQHSGPMIQPGRSLYHYCFVLCSLEQAVPDLRAL